MNVSRNSPSIHLQPPATVATHTENDVLLGSGKRLHRQNGGNMRLRDLVSQRFDEHEAADTKTDIMDIGLKKNRRDIKEEIVSAIKNQGGRFLKKSTKDESWTVATHEEAITKVVNEFTRVRKEIRGRATTRPCRPQPINLADFQQQKKQQRKQTRAGVIDRNMSPRDVSDVAQSQVMGAKASQAQSTFLQHVMQRDRKPSPVELTDLKPPPVAYPNHQHGGSHVLHEPEKSTPAFRQERTKTISAWKRASSGNAFAEVGNLHPLDSSRGTRTKARAKKADVMAAEVPEHLSYSDDSSKMQASMKYNVASVSSPLSASSALSGSDNMSWTVAAEPEDVLEDEMSGLSMSVPSSASRKSFSDSGSFGMTWSSSSNRNKSISSSSSNKNRSLSPGRVGSSLGRIIERETDTDTMKRNIKKVNDNFGDERLVEDFLKPLVKCSVDIEKEGLDGSWQEFDMIPFVRILVDATRRYPKNLYIQRDCSRALGCLASNEKTRELISKEGGINLLLEAMGRGLSSSDLLINCCRALANLSSNDAIAAETIQAGGIVSLVQSMAQYTKNERLQRHGCFALATLAIHSSSHKALAEDDRVGVLVRTMKKFRSDQRLQSKCCLALASFATVGHRLVLGKVGGVESVLRAMKAFPMEETLQQNSCVALAKLCVDDSNVANVIRGGGLDRIVDAMTAFTYSEELQQYGCASLRHIATDNAYAPAIDRSGGLCVVAKAMKNFPSNDRLQEYGCLVLATLAVDDRYHSTLVIHDGIAPMLASLKRCSSSNSQLQELGGLAVEALVRNDNCVSEAIDNSGIGLFVKAMTSLSDNNKMHESGCRVLADVALHRDGSEVLRKVRAVSVLSKSMAKYPLNRKIQENGCLALARLSMVHLDHGTIVVEGGIDRLVSALQAFPINASIHRYAYCALGNLAENNEGYATLIGKTDAMNILVKATETFASNEKVLGDICFALESLASASRKTRERLFSMQANDLARRAWKMLSARAKVKLITDISDIRDRILFPRSLTGATC